MADYAVKKAVKDFVASKNMKVSQTVYDALNKKIENLLAEAIERAKANKRVTLMAHDL